MNNKYDFKQIGKRIREERTNAQNATGRKKVMTQSDLANEIGVSRQTIAKWDSVIYLESITVGLV